MNSDRMFRAARLSPTSPCFIPPAAFVSNQEQELDFVGAYKTLTELHWPFDVVSEEQLTAESLASFKLLIIPHATTSDAGSS